MVKVLVFINLGKLYLVASWRESRHLRSWTAAKTFPPYFCDGANWGSIIS